MLRFALKNMAVKKLQVLLVLFSIVLSSGVALLAYNTASQVNDGITRGAAYYGAVIGPGGSATQLAMNTLYFTDEPLGTIPYSVVTELKKDNRVNTVIPFSMADSYNGYAVVGTTSDYLADKKLQSGRLPDDDAAMEVVLGATVAAVSDVRVGDEIYTSHAAGDVHTTPLRVVGILKPTMTSFDRVVFTQFRSIWEVHDHAHEEHGESEKTVCAVLVKTKNPSYAAMLVNEYDGKIYHSDGEDYALQAIEPMSAVRAVLRDADNTRYIVFILCAVILLLNILVICIITWLNMLHAKKEISLMRLIGIGMDRICAVYLLQNGIIGIAGGVLAFALSRLCMAAMRDYVADMGVIMDVGRIYPAEFLILAAVFVITLLPTLISVTRMARKDGLSDS